MRYDLPGSGWSTSIRRMLESRSEQSWPVIMRVRRRGAGPVAGGNIEISVVAEVKAAAVMAARPESEDHLLAGRDRSPADRSGSPSNRETTEPSGRSFFRT